MKARCQIASADCLGEAEVELQTDRVRANSCVPCGKHFQKKFPPQLYGLNIRPLAEAVEG